MSETMDAKARTSRAAVFLRSATVTTDFRETLFDACRREGVTPNEFVLQAAAEKLKSKGRQFSGLFRAGDLKTLNGGMGI
ncbi:hypothetical protein OCK02_02135 [Rhizobium sp. TRM96647]|uniref:hypothetical protein n=1 Tax=unclassified Rhizobium TaxID=2613769 RepID=UPI0021E6D9C0|nr:MULTISPECIES: hypothetical protein [unclassified Rhizobium]MCV3734988.1 hypothetical protein [Rhizobium sp. TRM96647]MCV3757358.1 hypothetical protein [Rhizobium sp. TRM96650]